MAHERFERVMELNRKQFKRRTGVYPETFTIDSGLGWRRTVAVSKALGKPNVTNTLPRGV